MGVCAHVQVHLLCAYCLHSADGVLKVECFGNILPLSTPQNFNMITHRTKKLKKEQKTAGREPHPCMTKVLVSGLRVWPVLPAWQNDFLVLKHILKVPSIRDNGYNSEELVSSFLI